MPVTFSVAEHPAATYEDTKEQVISKPEDVLAYTYGQDSDSPQCQELLQTSLPSGEEGVDWDLYRPQQNGFVHTIVDAYNHHHHLVLRPDDVWIAILTQFNVFVNAHAEELRSSFVEHSGTKHLVVVAAGNRYTVDFADLAHQMTEKVDENLLDKTLREWILPDFSTTAHNDTVVCAVLMMSTLKAYFTYEIRLRCGIPSITLLGTKADWASLLSRLPKLASFGEEPAAFAALLEPVLSRFVQTFDNDEKGLPQDLDFWNRICHVKAASGPPHLTGWLTAFCVWNKDGKWTGPPLPIQPASSSGDSISSRNRMPTQPRLVLDNIEYTKVNFNHVARGFCEVDVMLDDNGDIFQCKMVSGHVGTKVEGQDCDTLQPLSAWFMFIT